MEPWASALSVQPLLPLHTSPVTPFISPVWLRLTTSIEKPNSSWPRLNKQWKETILNGYTSGLMYNRLTAIAPSLTTARDIRNGVSVLGVSDITTPVRKKDLFNIHYRLHYILSLYSPPFCMTLSTSVQHVNSLLFILFINSSPCHILIYAEV